MIKNNKNKKAFTLIELLVSISVIALITILFIANYRSANKRTDLIMTAQTMTSDIHFAQSNALGLVRYGIYGVPAGGWGVYFDKINNTYTVFADLNEEETIGYKEYDSSLEGNIDYGAIVGQISQDLEIEFFQMAFLQPPPIQPLLVFCHLIQKLIYTIRTIVAIILNWKYI